MNKPKYKSYYEFQEDWIAIKGSDRLKKAVSKGYDMEQLFEEEFVKKELSPLGFLKSEGHWKSQIYTALELAPTIRFNIIVGIEECQPTLLELAYQESWEKLIIELNEKFGIEIFEEQKPFLSNYFEIDGKSCRVFGLIWTVRFACYSEDFCLFRLLDRQEITCQLEPDIGEKILINSLETNRSIDLIVNEILRKELFPE